MTVNQKLSHAFATLMARAGEPIEFVSERQEGRRGPPEQIYRRNDGRTLRLRTSAKGSKFLMANMGPAEQDPMTFEQDDFLGLVFRNGSKAVGYCIPSTVAAPDIRTATPLPFYRNDLNNFLWRFDVSAAGAGLAQKWAEYRLGEIELDDTTGPPLRPGRRDLNSEIADARRRIAQAAGRPENAVRITIEYKLAGEK